MKNPIAVALLIMFFLALPVRAERVLDLYSVTVPVADQGKKALSSGVREAFQQILLKVTGSNEVLSNAEVLSAGKRAQSYVLQYNYASSANTDPQQEDILLKVVFQRNAIQQLLRKAGLPMWTSNRPNVLIWLAVDDTRQRQTMGPETLPDLVVVSEQKAQMRGLPITIPLLDLEDSMAMAVDDIWRFKSERIQSASQRYQSDAILAGRVVITSTGKWMGSWWFEYQGKTLTFDGQGNNAESYVGYGIDHIANRLAEKYAIYPSENQDDAVQLVLGGINSFTDYADAAKYLKDLVSVRSLQIVEVDEDVIVYQLTIEGELDQLQNLLEIDKRMLPGNFPDLPELAADHNDESTILYYRWPTKLQ